MHTEPTDLDRAELRGELERGWGIDAVSLDHLPVGFGSHHWLAAGADGSRWFVTAADLRRGHNAAHQPDLAFARLDGALRAAAVLRDEGGLEFVLAPVRASDGSVVRRTGAHYAIRVEPFVDGTSARDGDFDDPGQRREMATLVGRLHAASAAVADAGPGRDDFALADREALEGALGDLNRAWNYGPFGEPTRRLLRGQAGAVGERLRGYDRLSEHLRATQAGWVLTHGEPHNANLLRAESGRLWLVDWDTALIAPPERDLWMVLDADLAGWDEYRAAGGADSLDLNALALYRERWALAEICEYVAGFRRPHHDSDDTREAWRELRGYLPDLPSG
jgi:spectinomycin phosphotransferase